MKTKKILAGFVFSLMGFLIAGNVFAIGLTPSGTHYPDSDTIKVICTLPQYIPNINYWIIFDMDNTLLETGNCGDFVTTTNWSIGNHYVGEMKTLVLYPTLSAYQADVSNIGDGWGLQISAFPPPVINGSCNTTHYNCLVGSSENNLSGLTSWTWSCAGSGGGTTDNCSQNFPPPPVIPIGLDIFGGTAPSSGTPFTGPEMTTQLTASVGNTMSGLGPIVAIVAGIILAFGIILKVVSLFSETDNKKETYKRIDIPSIAQTKQKFFIFGKNKK